MCRRRFFTDPVGLFSTLYWPLFRFRLLFRRFTVRRQFMVRRLFLRTKTTMWKPGCRCIVTVIFLFRGFFFFFHDKYTKIFYRLPYSNFGFNYRYEKKKTYYEVCNDNIEKRSSVWSARSVCLSDINRLNRRVLRRHETTSRKSGFEASLKSL